MVMESAMVRIHSEHGTTGIGESFLVHATSRPLYDALALGLAPVLIGADPFDSERLWQQMWAVASRADFRKAISAADQAIWDIKARALNVPLFELLGGRLVDSVIGYGTVAKRHDRYVDDFERLPELGFKAAKLAIGANVDSDVATVSEVADRVGDRLKLGIDANGAYTFDEALRLAHSLEDLGLLWFEEPLPSHDIRGLSELRRRVRLPIAGFQEEATIWRLQEYLEHDALSIYNVCLDLCGGVSVARKMSAMIEAAGKRLAPHAFGPVINYAATLHFAVASPNCEFLEYPVPDVTSADPRSLLWAPHVANAELFALRSDGTVSPPDLPGTGVELNEDALEEMTVEAQWYPARLP